MIRTENKIHVYQILGTTFQNEADSNLNILSDNLDSEYSKKVVFKRTIYKVCNQMYCTDEIAYSNIG